MKDRISSKTGYTLIFTSAALLLALALGVLALTCSAMGSSDAADSVPDGAVTPAPPAESTPAESGSAASDIGSRRHRRASEHGERRAPAAEHRRGNRCGNTIRQRHKAARYRHRRGARNGQFRRRRHYSRDSSGGDNPCHNRPHAAQNRQSGLNSAGKKRSATLCRTALPFIQFFFGLKST